MPTKQKQILFFCSFPPPNTGQTIGTKLTFDCINNVVAPCDKINIVDKKRLERKSGDFDLRYLFILIFKILQLIFSLVTGNYKYVYVVYSSTKFSLLRDVIYTYIIKTFSKAKIVAQIHSGNYGDNFKKGFYNKRLKWLLKKVDIMIFNSLLLNKVNSYIEPGKVAYIPNMISSDIICSDSEIENKIQYKKNNGFREISIFFISNMIEEKGYKDLTIAAGIFKRNYPKIDFTIYLIGGWPSQKIREDYINSLDEIDLSSNVKVYDSINDRQKLKSFFLKADIFVLPTYYPIEAQPFSIIEALNAATPVISTYHASIPDLIQDNVNGHLVNPKDVNAIVQSLYKLSDIENWERVARNARQSYKLKYAPSVIVPQLQRLFK